MKREMIKARLRLFCLRLIDPFERLNHKCFKAYRANKMAKLNRLWTKRQQKYPIRAKKDDEGRKQFLGKLNAVLEKLGPNATHDEICFELKKRYFTDARKLKLEGEV